MVMSSGPVGAVGCTNVMQAWQLLSEPGTCYLTKVAKKDFISDSME